MESKSSVVPRWANAWRGLSRSHQVLLMLTLAGAMALLGWGAVLRPKAFCSLLGERTLQPEELRQIQTTLVAAGVTDVRVEGNRIQVPVDKLPQCWEALNSEAGVGDSVSAREETAPAINMFMSRHQQDLVLQFDKKRRIRDMVGKLPFVKQVWVQLDATDASGPFAGRTYRCVVSVTTRDGHPLSNGQVHSVRQLALGSVAGMQPDDVLVADLGSGNVLSGGDSGPMMERAVAETQKREAENRALEKEIEQVLDEFPNLVVQVSQRSGSESRVGLPLDDHPVDLDAAGSQEVVRGNILMGTNGQARVPASFAKASSDAAASVPLKARSNLDPNRIVPGQNASKSIHISIPVDQIHRELSAQYPANVPDEAIRIRFDEVRRTIESRVHHLLSSSGYSVDSASIEIQLDPSRSETRRGEPVSSFFAQWTGQQSGAVLAIGSGILLCLVLGVSVRRRGRSSQINLSTETDSGHEVENLRSHINQLIDKDPEIVAEVLQDWIRKAG